ncbi:MAG TPA: hypothetical protein VIV08_04620, partial [Acidimicrobiia bacterium]
MKKRHLWIAAALLTFAAVAPAYAEQPTPPPDEEGTVSAPTPAEVDTPEFGPTDIDHSEPLRDQ